ncbi:DUF3613 domain-containing protein [Parasulfuritortus cantonensis]|uniref:DUF3613 domain-containing protein n=1 Tax=Parasulfuritortus cantonensis TaxID=2528202 RepID=A0A4R1BKP7_9PROT|nr:DUF3613 domain-containing protein [Parasulfuritortus cantonensis]TCJ17971.1 DUF3613 domain-containing protein [Parasulfuritortus cantonensis]
MSPNSHRLAYASGLLLSSLLLSGPAGAEEQAAQTNGPAAIVIGGSTERMLELQREGSAAGTLNPVSGDVASASYKRYLESFDKPMPDFKDTVASSTKLNSK